jgi:hypothetical protein
MNLQQRMDLLTALGEYMLSDNTSWQTAREKASYENGWFIPPFIDKAIHSIAASFLQKDILSKWAASYQLPAHTAQPKTIGIVMAGNIPMVGFHDLLCVFIAGHRSLVKSSSKDKVLIPHLVDTMISWDPGLKELIGFADMLKGCDAYIATGINISAVYFYF